MSLEQLNAMTDLELDEACALAHGWDEVPHGRDEKVWDTGIGDFIYNYHPTANTVEGRSQCFELMVKYYLDVLIYEDGGGRVLVYITKTQAVTRVEFESSPQRAICKAVILSVQEK